MKRRQFLGGCACCGLLAAHRAMAEPLPWVMPERLSKPEEATDEGGLWAMLDREEAKLRRSKFLIRDEALNKYVSDIACRLAGPHCPDMRVYIVRTPHFNATMTPNGMMQVWSGLLLRMNNEAQLAAILGHEMGHYLQRHGVERMRDLKSRSAFATLLAGFGLVGAIGQLAMLGGMYSFSRDQESEADRIGLELMAAAGYEPIEASTVWDSLLAELKAEADWTGEPANRSVLFATHPAEDLRRDDLAARAKAMQPAQRRTEDARWRQAMAPFRWEFLEDELRRRRFGESLALLDRKLRETPNDGTLLYFRGEVYRQRGTAEDVDKALESYAQAERQPGAPAQLYRSRALIMQSRGDDAAAKINYQSYLSKRPDAEDRELIASYLK